MIVIVKTSDKNWTDESQLISYNQFQSKTIHWRVMGISRKNIRNRGQLKKQNKKRTVKLSTARVTTARNLLNMTAQHACST